MPIVLAVFACDPATASEALGYKKTLGAIPADDASHGELQGVYVQGIEPGSAAAEAGIQEGDIIVAVDQKPIGSPAALFEAIRDHKGDTPILLQIRRGDSIFFAALDTKPED